MPTLKRKYNRHYPGERKNKLTLISRIPGGHKWKCVCDCGNEVVIQISCAQSMCATCSKKQTSIKMTKHGFNKRGRVQAIYTKWINMKNRCNNPKNKSFKYYGGRGISVCKEWSDDFQAFCDWAMKHGYRDDLTIERVDVNGNYEPNNCKWIEFKEQGKNTRRNHFVEIDGQVLCVMDWCRKIGMGKSNAYVHAKQQGLTIEEYLTKHYWLRKPEMQDIPARIGRD